MDERNTTTEAIEGPDNAEKLNGREPETIDGKTGMVIPPGEFKRRYRQKYSMVIDCRRAMVKILGRLQRGEISNDDAKTQTYILATIRDTLVACDLEERIAAIEAGSGVPALPYRH